MAYRFVNIASSERSELLYEQIKAKSKIKKVNAMLRALKKEGLYDESIAVENIFNYLDSTPMGVGKTKSGYISTRNISSKNVTQLTGISKSISEFIKNKTSTVSGMYDLFEERRLELGRFIDDSEFVKNLSYKDIRDIYKVFQSNEYKKLQSRMGSPEFFTLMTQSIDEKWNKDRFTKEINYYLAESNDEDLKENIINIYDDYIRKYSERK